MRKTRVTSKHLHATPPRTRITRSSTKKSNVMVLLTSPPQIKPLSSKHEPLPSTWFPALQIEATRIPLKIHAKRHKLPNLTAAELRLLRRKQQKLKSTAADIVASLHLPVLPALLSTLIFAADHAGTAVVVHKSGIVLTCAHCFAESQEEYDSLTVDTGKRKWTLAYDGTAVLLELLVWDHRRDLAMCRVIGLEAGSTSSKSISNKTPLVPNFTYLSLSARAPKLGTDIYCIGQPGAEDLESSVPGTKTQYNLFEISEGRFRGLVKGQDVNDNEKIGCLMHDAWTYWGHSGAPLFVIDEKKQECRLVGLHSSWDDETAVRHGIPWEAVGDFIKEHENV